MRRLAVGLGAGALTGLLLVSGCSQPTTTSPGTAPDSTSPGSPSSRGPGSGTEVRHQPLRPARNATALATRLVAAEDAVRSPATPARTAELAGFTTQVLYRQLARRPAWQAKVLHEVPPRYRTTVRAHLTARTQMRSILTTLSDTLPAWEIVPSAPAGELLGYYRKAERVFGVDWEVLAAINLVETGLGKIRGVSSAGAQGPMQFMPPTWAAYGKGDVNDPHDAIMGAARYLAATGGDSPATLDRALRAYNNHGGYVDGVKAYAEVLREDRRAFRGFHQWQIIYLSSSGDIWLPVGYRSPVSVPVSDYIAQHPQRRLGTATH